MGASAKGIRVVEGRQKCGGAQKKVMCLSAESFRIPWQGKPVPLNRESVMGLDPSGLPFLLTSEWRFTMWGLIQGLQVSTQQYSMKTPCYVFHNSIYQLLTRLASYIIILLNYFEVLPFLPCFLSYRQGNGNLEQLNRFLKWTLLAHRRVRIRTQAVRSRDNTCYPLCYTVQLSDL